MALSVFVPQVPQVPMHREPILADNLRLPLQLHLAVLEEEMLASRLRHGATCAYSGLVRFSWASLRETAK
jgi:hypothetical protein